MKDMLRQFGFSSQAEMQPFHSSEDGSAYSVWKITDGEKTAVLKKAKGSELAVYKAFFREKIPGVPGFLGSGSVDGEDYLLMEYVSGEDLCRCDREKLRKALDALIALQDRFWDVPEQPEGPISFANSLAGRENRGKFLNDPALEKAYDRFLELFKTLPRTLCHDDLLPFNVLAGEQGAAIIDWEAAGILPYPVSLARLIAHGSEDADAFFYMTEADKDYAIGYYYGNVVKSKGISWDAYREAVDYFLLYEYCEWIMLGNRYADADMVRFRQYQEKARTHLQTMNA